MKAAAIPPNTAPLHEGAIADRLAAAELYCQAKGQRLTEQRKEVLTLLLKTRRLR